jgi:hypothetical protein
MGTTEQPPLGGDISFYDGREDVQIYHGYHAIDDLFQNKFRSQQVLGIRDYYPW